MSPLPHIDPFLKQGAHVLHQIGAIFASSGFNPIDCAVKRRQKEQGEGRSSRKAAGHGNGHGVPEGTGKHRDKTQDGCERGQHDGTEAHQGGLDNGFVRCHASFFMEVNLLDDDHGVADDRANKGKGTYFCHNTHGCIEKEQSQGNPGNAQGRPLQG